MLGGEHEQLSSSIKYSIRSFYEVALSGHVRNPWKDFDVWTPVVPWKPPQQVWNMSTIEGYKCECGFTNKWRTARPLGSVGLDNNGQMISKDFL